MRRLLLFAVVLGLVGAVAGGCAHGGPAPIAKLDDALDGRPVRYSRSLVARVRAAGALPDVTDVMDDKARVLVAVARLTDADLTDYQQAEGESGAPPAKRFVRDLALGFLVHSNLYLNSEITRQVLAERVRDSDDVRVQLLLAPILDSLLGSATRSAMAMPQAPFDLRATVTSWIDWTKAQLARTPDPMTYELVLARLAALGRFGPHLGIVDQTTALFDGIIAARGDVALTAGSPTAAFDLAVTALAARHDLGVTARGYYIPALPRAGEPFDLWARMSEPPRPAEPNADAAFDALAAPLLVPVIHYDRYTHKKIRDAFALAGVGLERRARVMRRLLFLRDDELSQFDTTGLQGAMVLPHGSDEIVEQAARILADTPELVDSAVIRDAVHQFAVRAFDTAGYISRDEPLVVLHPVFLRWLRAAPETVRIEVLRSWMSSIRVLAARTDSHIFHANEASIDRLIALGELAPGVGLADEARATCDAVLASPAAPMTRNTNAILKRGATIARALLTSS